MDTPAPSVEDRSDATLPMSAGSREGIEAVAETQPASSPSGADVATLAQTSTVSGREGDEEPTATVAMTGTGAAGGVELGSVSSSLAETAFMGGEGPAPITRLGAASSGGVGSTDKYSRTRLHARGGLGQVWLARDDILGREVALKELRPDREGNDEILARFVTEAKITGLLEHPGIVPVYDLEPGPSGRHPFYTMRFIRGRTLHEAIVDYHKKRAEGGDDPLARSQLLNAFVGVCQAIGFAHARGVIHRDLKGQNVVLGDFGEAMVLDWGLARLIDEPERGPDSPDGVEKLTLDADLEATRQGQVLGTPAYMAPEQAAGKIDQIGPRTDIYALGAILYEILVGVAPYRAVSVTEILRQVREEAPERPRAANPSVPPALEAVCLKAMARRPEERYATATDLADEVQRWLADEPVSAYPEPWTKRLARWSKRHRSAVAATAAFLVLGAGALGVSTVLVRAERDRAREQRAEARRAVDQMYTEVAETWLADRLDPVQKTFLERAVGYYERFAADESSDPAARAERGRAYLRMGDALRKLGRGAEAETSYRRADEVLQGLPRSPDVDPVAARLDQARARSGLGLALASRGSSSEADAAYRAAADVLPDASSPAVEVERGRLDKRRGDLARLRGQTRVSEALYRDAVRNLEAATASSGGGPEDLAARSELARALDALALLLKDNLGREADAMELVRKAIDIEEGLVAEAPTVPRYREALARAVNTLALGLLDAGNPREAETALRRELDLQGRLAADYPDRPEYRRALARANLNLAILLSADARTAASEPHFDAAIELNGVLAGAFPAETQYRLDLAKCLTSLGAIQLEGGRIDDARTNLDRARVEAERLIAATAQEPRHRQLLASILVNLSQVANQEGKPEEAEAHLIRARDTLIELSESDPANREYKSELAHVLDNLGQTLATLPDRKAEADGAYARAIALLEPMAGEKADRETRRRLAAALNNRGELRLDGALESYARSGELYEALAAEFPDAVEDRSNLASVRNNTGEAVRDKGDLVAAREFFDRSIADFDALATRYPTVPDFSSLMGYVLENRGKIELDAGLAGEARPFLERAVAAQRKALESRPKSSSMRAMLVGHLRALATARTALGDHAGAAELADAILKADPAGATGPRDASRVLAVCASLVGTDARLSDADRARLSDQYADRAVALLSEAVRKGGAALRPRPDDADFAALRPRDDFRALAAP
jgi:serine/threonine-protein kinase